MIEWLQIFIGGKRQFSGMASEKVLVVNSRMKLWVYAHLLFNRRRLNGCRSGTTLRASREETDNQRHGLCQNQARIKMSRSIEMLFGVGALIQIRSTLIRGQGRLFGNKHKSGTRNIAAIEFSIYRMKRPLLQVGPHTMMIVV